MIVDTLNGYKQSHIFLLWDCFFYLSTCVGIVYTTHETGFGQRLPLIY